MSIVTLKKKTAAVYSKNHSNQGGDLYWVGTKKDPFIYAKKGFSLNGPHRNVGYVGQDMKYSKAFTSMKGTVPLDSNGNNSKIIYNVTDSMTEIKGKQLSYNKSSVLSTYGMLRNKYTWAYSGTFPHFWVQPDSTNGNYQFSQESYISKKSAANSCVIKKEDGIDTIKDFGDNKGRLDCANNYTKTLNNVVDSSVHTQNITQPCANPTDSQKPFPFAVNNAGCNTYLYSK